MPFCRAQEGGARCSYIRSHQVAIARLQPAEAAIVVSYLGSGSRSNAIPGRAESGEKIHGVGVGASTRAAFYLDSQDGRPPTEAACHHSICICLDLRGRRIASASLNHSAAISR